MNRILCKHFLWSALVACLGLMAVPSARAEEVKKAEEKKPGEAAAKTITPQEMAFGLVHFGRDTKSPESLIAAALILHANPIETPKGEKIEVPTPRELLDEARALRPNDKALGTLIDTAIDTVKETSRAAVAPAKVVSLKLPPKKPIKPR